MHPPFIAQGSIRAVPSLHGHYRFAALVRRAFCAERPAAIAVELPATLEPALREGVARLPYLSVVGYQDFNEALEPITNIVPVTPDDSLIEAVRLGSAEGVPVHFIDRDVLGYRPTPIRAPDDHLVERLGLERYCREVAAGLTPPEPGSPDDLREAEMAARLRELAAGPGPVLFVCGLAHWEPIRRRLGRAEPAPPGAVTQRETKLYNLGRDSVPRVLLFPYLGYTYELTRVGLAPGDFPQLLPLPDTKGDELEAARDAAREAKRELLAALTGRPTGPRDFDHYETLGDMVQGVTALYRREWNEQPSLARLQTMLRYARNLALVAHRLTPTRYQLVLAAKNAVNDDYAYQCFRLANHYPFFEEDSALPEMQVGEGQGEAEGEPITLRLRLPRSLQPGEGEGEPIELPAPAEEGEEGSWRERWEVGDHHVSHLPQDGRLEAFFQYIRERARKVLADNQVRVHPLKASLMDGLDLRETLRHLVLGQVYVKEQLPGVGEVGPVVAIFHRPGEDHLYPHEKMWFSEHPGESDLALYSTQPGTQFDGPGISRCHYGGVLSLYPPGGRAAVWGNPRYGGVRNRAELLLKAAIDLSRKPIVAYVAPQGPSPEMMSLAASRGIHILYLPLDSLSADLVKRVRLFHVLADRDVRPLAHAFIN